MGQDGRFFRDSIMQCRSRRPRSPACLHGPDRGFDSHIADALAHLHSEGIRVFEASPDHFDLYEYYRERVEQA